MSKKDFNRWKITDSTSEGTQYDASSMDASEISLQFAAFIEAGAVEEYYMESLLRSFWVVLMAAIDPPAELRDQIILWSLREANRAVTKACEHLSEDVGSDELGDELLRQVHSRSLVIAKTLAEHLKNNKLPRDLKRAVRNAARTPAIG